MHKLIIKYNKQLKMLNLRDGKTYTISEDERADITLKSLGEVIHLEQNNQGTWQANHTSINKVLVRKGDLDDITLQLYTEADYASFAYPSIQDTMTIGPNAYDDMVIQSLMNAIIIKDFQSIQESQYVRIVHDKNTDVYINYELQEQLTNKAYIGDHIYVEGIWLEVQADGLNVLSQNTVASSLIRLTQEMPHAQADDYNTYHRSPRIIHREPTDDIKIERPPQPIQKNNTVIWRSIIPPLVMIALTVVIFLVRPIGIYILMMIGMSTVTIVFGITTYFSEKKKYNKDVEKREKDYKAYLDNKSKEINKAIKAQRFSLNYHYPTVAEIKDIVETKAPRIYEKTSHHHDFLHYKLGIANVEKSFKLDYQEEEFNQRRDELFDDAKELYEFYTDVEQAPLINDLNHGPIAYIGARHLILEELEKMLIQLSTFHSYHDLEFLFVTREDEVETLKWARWLPHMTLRGQNIRGFVYNQRTRDQILTSIYSMIKERIQAVRERSRSNEQIIFTPQLVFVITDMSLIIDHVILEYVNQDLSEYGISLIFVEDVIESLPEHVDTIIDIKSRTEGELITKEKELVQLKFTPENIDNVDKEYIARRLANLIHVEHLKNAIPDSITFLEMYNVKEVEQLDVVNRWRQNETYKTMAVPLGVRGKDDILSLNLHEKAHGPHGLVAGTTGSGKSEIIQSYILSLAINFHPHEVAFLLIDYKGGGMANLFKDLVHLVGTITNLDGDEAMRALTSIKAELRKRQRLFGEHDVNHINQYHKLFKEGVATEPMPHLFIISDEFAELKSEQPDFMKELVSTARIGRSLGIHLILATQKPSGVVDDQIWSNSKFKLALKVQDRQDSNEILKTPDAADITLPGRAYLQVGNNEIYELFQSAWSGATYDIEGDKLEVEDKTIYMINDYGQLQAINKDLSGLEDEEAKENQTELEAVIDHIESITTRLEIEEVKRPWLPPLPENVYQEDLVETDFRKLWSDDAKEVELTLGLKDVPEEQYQGPMVLQLKKAGHIALIGSPGYGRTTFLHNIIFDVVRHHRPDQAHMYLFDFGTNGLMPVTDIPHVADYFTVDQEDKIAKAIRKIHDIISERKRLLSQERVVNIEQYNKETGNSIPNVFLIIDNYDTVKESPFMEEYEEMMSKVTREGLALGVYIILSGSRSSAIKSAIFTNIKTRVALYLFENNELTNIIGSYKKGVKDVKGRAAINDDNFTQFQIAQPFELAEGQTYNEHIKNEVAQMKEFYVGDYPKHIPMMPDKVFMEDIREAYDLEKIIHEEHKLPLGLDFEDVELVSLDLTSSSIVTAIKPTEMEKMNDIIMSSLSVYSKNQFVILVDAEDNMSQYADDVTSYYSAPSDLSNIRLGFKQEIEARKNGEKSIEECKIVFINNIKRFNQLTGMTEDEIRMLFNEGQKVNIIIIASGLYSDTIGAFDRESKMMVRTINQALISHKISEQEFIRVKDRFGEPELKAREMYYINNQEYQKIKLMEG
ncbi:type VII secretion protein EssC [Staphylococcus aureus]|uniref:type VII secretion protein EssC n=1 Tax=Staphylococcus aureus TaxID=1280 RepID=UPI000F43AACE|nr:type VII secretion protein EssC [Staphylococcus aureus]MBH4785742.1 type VII secretion protein EssC [Staphylococcus aureus]MBH4787929.1 type VII secretion protein EssC [Staphylococcus aureus]MBH4803706.1 type VII secretion protein EssC [Staphylococcus aureus]MBH4811257.1 type VII secretion protein EssC [Staphylococcus aureus]MBH4845468.1 type VII secretion protein EssC [Staphylococcus aureus]